MQKRVRHIFAALQLLVIFFWLGGTTLFIHKHDIDGKGIVHSHPYAGDADGHGHSANNILLINKLANLDFTVDDNAISECILIAKHIDEATDIVEPIQSVDLRFISLRAPPAVA